MSEAKKPVRSSSGKIKGMIDATLKIPGKLERRLSREDKAVEKIGLTPDNSPEVDPEEDSDQPDLLPILATRSKQKTGNKNSLDVKKKEINGGEEKLISSEGMIKYEDMLSLLRCGNCNQLSCPPILQCRKGHIYCSNCKQDKKMMQCNLCKQTFVDAPNLAMDKLVRLIAIPCKYGSHGCQEFVFLDSRLQHETLCKFRPVHCQYEKHGCKAVFAIKDMCWHHRMCEFAHYPHPNILPNMPSRKKSSKNGDEQPDQPATAGSLPNGTPAGGQPNSNNSIKKKSQKES